MKMKFSGTVLLVSLLGLTACGETMSDDERQRRIDDWRQVGQQIEKDLNANADSLVRACVTRLEGQPIDDARLGQAPFRKTVSGEKIQYHGHWKGDYVAQVDKVLLMTEPGECHFMVGTELKPIEGRKFQAYQLKPLYAQQFNKSGYRLSKFVPALLGERFANASLRALIPGPTYKNPEGRLTAKKGPLELDIEIYTIRNKSDQEVQRQVIEIKK